MVGPGKASALWASFKVEAGFGPWPYTYKKIFFNSNFLLFANLFKFKSNSNAE
jgi:hypothetical protein